MTGSVPGHASVQLNQVGHAFSPEHPLYNGLTEVLEDDQIYAITGPSGSGKSTLLGILAGWITPSQGEVRTDVKSIQWVFQNPHGVARRTALDHVSIPFIAQGMTRHEADSCALELLDEFGLRSVAQSPFSSLSGGEAQRLMLARGVASKPDLLLVDEPTAQLDRKTADEVNRSLQALAGRGVIVVIATHDPQTMAMCTRIIDLADMASTELEDDIHATDQPTASVPGGRFDPNSVTIMWREAFREAWRNVVSGTTHAASWAAVLMVITVLLGGLDSFSVRTVVEGAVNYQNQGGATWVLEASGLIDGVACDSLASVDGILAAGAVRQVPPGLVTSLLPRTPVPLYAVTPGFAYVLGVHSPSPGLGIWVSSGVADRYGIEVPGVLATPGGPVPVGGTFDYPADGRSGELSFSIAAPTLADDGVFDTCWFTVWPVDESLVALSRIAVVPTQDPSVISQVTFRQLNMALGSSYDGLSDFANRPSRFASWVTLFAAAGLGIVAFWSRRLEHASDLHAGIPKPFILLESLTETGIWALSGAVLATPLILLIAGHASADAASIALLGVRPLLTGVIGALLGATLGVLLSREHQLFNLFRNR